MPTTNVNWRLRTVLTKTPIAAGDLLEDRSGARFRLDSWGPGAEVFVVREGGARRKIRANLHEFGLEIYEHEPKIN